MISTIFYLLLFAIYSLILIVLGTLAKLFCYLTEKYLIIGDFLSSKLKNQWKH